MDSGAWCDTASSKFYVRAFYHRLESDYGEIAELEAEDITADLLKAEGFITRIESDLQPI